MANDEMIINSSIDQIFENLPIGSITKSIGNNLYGINFRQTPSFIPRAKEHYGFTFFTRPQLNLTRPNISNFRTFYSLLSRSTMSYQSYVRAMLDPRLSLNGNKVSSFVDNENPFIPILTNSLVSLSGFPDLTVPTYTSDTGSYGQELSFVDGTVNHYESYDIDATFANYKGNPLIYMFYIWIRYQTLVFEGILTPYMDLLVENEIDYNTRIYRIVLDSKKTYVMHIAATGASFPINVPTGNIFDYNIDTPLNTKNSEINIRFRCMGFLAFEDILKLEFNKTIAIFNPHMRIILKHDLNEKESQIKRDDPTIVYRIKGSKYVKIPRILALNSDSSIENNSFYNINFRAIPYINLATNELEWFIDETLFNKKQQEKMKEIIETQESQSTDFDMVD